MQIEYDLRQAKIRDATQIGHLSRTIIEYELGWSWTPQRIIKKIKDKNTDVVVAVEGNHVVGFAVMGYLENEAHLDLFGDSSSDRRPPCVVLPWTSASQNLQEVYESLLSPNTLIYKETRRYSSTVRG